MKKWIALLMAVAMLMSFTSALGAEYTIGEPVTGSVTLDGTGLGFGITMVVPEGYEMVQYTTPDAMYLVIDSPVEDTPNFIISIAYDDESEGLTLNDLSDGEQAILVDTMIEDFAQAEENYLTTEHGTEVIMLNEVSPDAESFFAVGFTLYKGYFIQISEYKPNFAKLEQADLDLATKILSDLWFIEAAAE